METHTHTHSKYTRSSIFYHFVLLGWPEASHGPSYTSRKITQRHEYHKVQIIGGSVKSAHNFIQTFFCWSTMHHCHKICQISNLKDKMFILLHGFRVCGLWFLNYCFCYYDEVENPSRGCPCDLLLPIRPLPKVTNVS